MYLFDIKQFGGIETLSNIADIAAFRIIKIGA